MTPVTEDHRNELLVRQYQASKQLWANVMWQALCDAVRGCKAKRSFQRQVFLDAMEWFNSDETHVGSFSWVCGIVNIDPERARQRVQRLVEQARNGGKLPRRLESNGFAPDGWR